MSETGRKHDCGGRAAGLRFLAFVLPAVLTALLPSSALAEVGDPPSAEEIETGRRVMQRFAGCVVKHKRQLARDYVLSPSSEKLAEEDFGKLVSSNCLRRNGELRMAGNYYRAALAEELIRREYPGATFDFSAVPALHWATPVFVMPQDGKSMEDAERNLARDQAFSYANRLAECVVRIDPVEAHSVLATEAGSADELAELREIAPRIAQCVPKGETVKFNRTNLRAGMAISYYRMAAVASAAGVPGVSE